MFTVTQTPSSEVKTAASVPQKAVKRYVLLASSLAGIFTFVCLAVWFFGSSVGSNEPVLDGLDIKPKTASVILSHPRTATQVLVQLLTRNKVAVGVGATVFISLLVMVVVLVVVFGQDTVTVDAEKNQVFDVEEEENGFIVSIPLIAAVGSIILLTIGAASLWYLGKKGKISCLKGAEPVTLSAAQSALKAQINALLSSANNLTPAEAPLNERQFFIIDIDGEEKKFESPCNNYLRYYKAVSNMYHGRLFLLQKAGTDHAKVRWFDDEQLASVADADAAHLKECIESAMEVSNGFIMKITITVPDKCLYIRERIQSKCAIASWAKGSNDEKTNMYTVFKNGQRLCEVGKLIDSESLIYKSVQIAANISDDHPFFLVHDQGDNLLLVELKENTFTGLSEEIINAMVGQLRNGVTIFTLPTIPDSFRNP